MYLDCTEVITRLIGAIMLRYDEYLVTIDTMPSEPLQASGPLYVAGSLRPATPMPVREDVWGGVVDRVRNWAARRRGRSALLEMNDYQLRDIGISRVEADVEAARSIFLN
jgi:uncharacterized protein YjiS (DUF1127 family)